MCIRDRHNPVSAPLHRFPFWKAARYTDFLSATRLQKVRAHKYRQHCRRLRRLPASPPLLLCFRLSASGFWRTSFFRFLLLSLIHILFCHLTADFHALLIQLHQLAVNPVYFIPERRQIHERFLHLYFLLLILAQFAWNLKFCTYYFHEKIV